MKYELIGKNNYLEPIETVLKNRGIDNIQSFLAINGEDTIHWSKLRNIEKAIDCFLKHIEKGNKVFIQVDADPDGYTSSALLISYLTKTFPKVNIQWRLHEGKEHGVIVTEVPNDIDLVILPDAGSNQYEEHKQLKDRNIDVIVLDHHDCDLESEDAIVVNSQISPNYPNKQLSGVGITYKFCKALDDKLGIKHADEYIDLVAIGNIADSQDMRSLETRYYVMRGLKNIKNKFILSLFDKQSFSTKGVINITSTSFYINPLINACIRVGNMQEKIQMFNALLESTELIYYERKKVHESIEVNTSRLLGNLKAKQDRMRNKATVEIAERIENKSLLKNKLLIVDISDILHKNLTGVVANKCAEQYKRPTMLLRYSDDREYLTGSIRGYDKGHVKDFKSLLQKTEKFEFVEGHANAAGFKIRPENIIEVNELINEELKNIEVDMDLYEVDFILKTKQLTKHLIIEINKYKDLWGHKVDEPLLAIKDIEINKDEIYLNGKTAKTIKFEHKGMEYIKSFSKEEEYESLINMGERLVIDVIGKCSVNEWKGVITPQIEVVAYEVTKIKKKEYVF